jgi:hypothetical protein
MFLLFFLLCFCFARDYWFRLKFYVLGFLFLFFGGFLSFFVWFSFLIFVCFFIINW